MGIKVDKFHSSYIGIGAASAQGVSFCRVHVSGTVYYLCSRFGHALVLLTLAVSLLEQSAHAANRTWANTGTVFNTSSSWNNGSDPGSNDVAVFDSAAITQPRLALPTTIQELNFSTTTSSGYDLTSPGPSYTLTLLNTCTGTTSAINAANTSGTNTIDAPLILGAASNSTQTFTQASGGTFIINGVISSTNTVALSLTGGGIFQLSGANTYSGGTTLASGTTLDINNATALGTGTFTINGGTIDNTSAGSITLSNNNAETWNSGFTFTGTQNLNLGTGAVSLGTAAGTSRTVTTNANSLTIGGVISNGTTANSLIKAGSGTLVLSGANTYSGTTTVNAGSLFVNGSTASASAVTANNSGTTLGGSGTINGSVNVVSSGANLSPGASGVGTTAILRTGALTLSSGSNFNVDLNNTTAGTGYDQASVTGTVSINGSNIVVTVGSSFSVGDKFFILLNDGTDLVTGTFAQGTTVTSSSNGDIFSINYADNGDGGSVGNDISLTVTAVPEPATYAVAVLTLGALALHQRRRLFTLFGCSGARVAHKI